MSILINNSVINRKGTPSIITDTFANRPLATSLQLGTIFFSSNTNNIYQVEPFGSTQAWAVMGGGGGGSQNLDNVLYQGGLFTNDRSSNLGGYGWEIYNFNYFELQNINNQLWRFTDTSLNYYNSVGTNTFFSLNYTTGQFAMGDFGGTINGTHMNINVPSNNIYFAPAGNGFLIIQNGSCTIGDFNNVLNTTKLNVDDNNRLIVTNIGGVDNGIRLQNDYLGSGIPNFKFGEFEGITNAGYIEFSNALQYKIGSEIYGLEISSGDSWCWFGDREGYISGGHLFIYNNDNPFSALNCSGNYPEWGFKVSFVAQTIENPDYYTVTIGDWLTYSGALGASIELYNSIGNETYITFWNANQLIFDNCNILEPSASDPSGNYLRVKINGTIYLIELWLPNG